MGEGKPWRTEIADVKPNDIRVRGYDLLDLIGNRTFGDVVFLLLPAVRLQFRDDIRQQVGHRKLMVCGDQVKQPGVFEALTGVRGRVNHAGLAD